MYQEDNNINGDGNTDACDTRVFADRVDAEEAAEKVDKEPGLGNLDNDNDTESAQHDSATTAEIRGLSQPNISGNKS